MSPYRWDWDLEALLLVPLLLAAYVIALRRFPASRWRVACFGAGLALVLGVSISPLQTIALDYLLSAHLLQNVVLSEWAPALCVLGVPPALALELGRLPGVRTLTHPLVALPLWLLTTFLWHLPVAYEAALEHRATLLHLEHGSYFAAGVLLWWPVLQDAPRRVSSGGRAGYLFAAFLLASPLGLLLTFLTEPIYSVYADGPGLWGLGPLTDQQVAGVTMTAELSVIFFAAFLVFLLRFLREEEEHDLDLRIAEGSAPG